MELKHTWLPDSLPINNTAINIQECDGSYLILDNNQKIYDAISSWWCKPLGHRHPIVTNSILEQLHKFEHHIPANAYNNIIEELSYKLTQIFENMGSVMYASDGSSAVEIACKISLDYRNITNDPHRNKFIALNGAYHGETIFALSLCGINSYKTPYKNILHPNYFIDDIVYVNTTQDEAWYDSQFNHSQWNDYFSQIQHEVTAFIIEPIVQGANGLKIISRDFLINLIRIAQNYDIHIICDEIMVGLGRIGYYSVSKEILNFEPDFVCFGKNLTCGSLPMSAVVINNRIRDLFSKVNRIFPHSHTHSCNAMAAKVAVNYLNYLENSNFLHTVRNIEDELFNIMLNLTKKFNFATNPRVIGGIAACHLDLSIQSLEQIHKIGIENGIYLRPIGNTLYIMPPLHNINNETTYIEEKLISTLNKL